MSERPSFVWDMPIDESELRARLRDPDPRVRAQWQGWVLAEARFDDVWRYLRLGDVLRDWERIEPHLGRRRAYWKYLLEAWRELGLLPAG